MRWTCRRRSFLMHPGDNAYPALSLWTDIKLLALILRLRSDVLVTTRPLLNIFLGPVRTTSPHPGGAGARFRGRTELQHSNVRWAAITRGSTQLLRSPQRIMTTWSAWSLASR